MTCTDETEPQGSAGSSGDERAFCAQCKHHSRYHTGVLCTVCPAFTGDHRHEFISDLPLCEGCPDPEHGDDPCEAEGCWCRHPVPEPFVCVAPEGRCPDSDSCFYGCQAAADGATRPGEDMEPEVQPLRCPSYAVAYATGSGALIELALPGEASVAVVSGALVICHPSGVLGIQRVKPCGEDV